MTARALRRNADVGPDAFPEDVVELINYLLASDGPATHPAAMPGRGYLPEMWLLGSSTFSAQLAGMLGLSFSFAYHFAPDLVDRALEEYRARFRPSILLDRPRVMVAVAVVCAPDQDEARWLAAPSGLALLQLRAGRPAPVATPEEAAAYRYTDQERVLIEEGTSSHLVGDPDQVRRGLVDLVERTSADEIMISTRAHSYQARIRSLSLVAEHWPLEPTASSSSTPAA